MQSHFQIRTSMAGARIVVPGRVADGEDLPSHLGLLAPTEPSASLLVREPLRTPFGSEEAVAMFFGPTGVEGDHDLDEDAFLGLEEGDLTVGSQRGLLAAPGGTPTGDGYTAVVQHF